MGVYESALRSELIERRENPDNDATYAKDNNRLDGIEGGEAFYEILVGEGADSENIRQALIDKNPGGTWSIGPDEDGITQDLEAIMEAGENNPHGLKGLVEEYGRNPDAVIAAIGGNNFNRLAEIIKTPPTPVVPEPEPVVVAEVEPEPVPSTDLEVIEEKTLDVAENAEDLAGEEVGKPLVANSNVLLGLIHEFLGGEGVADDVAETTQSFITSLQNSGVEMLELIGDGMQFSLDSFASDQGLVVSETAPEPEPEPVITAELGPNTAPQMGG